MKNKIRGIVLCLFIVFASGCSSDFYTDVALDIDSNGKGSQDVSVYIDAESMKGVTFEDAQAKCLEIFNEKKPLEDMEVTSEIKDNKLYFNYSFKFKDAEDYGEKATKIVGKDVALEIEKESDSNALSYRTSISIKEDSKSGSTLYEGDFTKWMSDALDEKKPFDVVPEGEKYEEAKNDGEFVVKFNGTLINDEYVYGLNTSTSVEASIKSVDVKTVFEDEDTITRVVVITMNKDSEVSKEDGKKALEEKIKDADISKKSKTSLKASGDKEVSYTMSITSDVSDDIEAFGYIAGIYGTSKIAASEDSNEYKLYDNFNISGIAEEADEVNYSLELPKDVNIKTINSEDFSEDELEDNGYTLKGNVLTSIDGDEGSIMLTYTYTDTMGTILKIGGIVLLILLLALGGFFGFKYYKKNKDKISEKVKDLTKTDPQATEVVVDESTEQQTSKKIISVEYWKDFFLGFADLKKLTCLGIFAGAYFIVVVILLLIATLLVSNNMGGVDSLGVASGDLFNLISTFFLGYLSNISISAGAFGVGLNMNVVIPIGIFLLAPLIASVVVRILTVKQTKSIDTAFENVLRSNLVMVALLFVVSLFYTIGSTSGYASASIKFSSLSVLISGVSISIVVAYASTYLFSGVSITKYGDMIKYAFKHVVYALVISLVIGFILALIADASMLIAIVNIGVYALTILSGGVLSQAGQTSFLFNLSPLYIVLGILFFVAFQAMFVLFLNRLRAKYADMNLNKFILIVAGIYSLIILVLALRMSVSISGAMGMASGTLIGVNLISVITIPAVAIGCSYLYMLVLKDMSIVKTLQTKVDDVLKKFKK